MPGQLRPFAPHPGLQIGDKRQRTGAANGEALIGGKTIDVMFDGEERIDARHRFQRQRRHGRQLAARLGGDIGEHEELASGMRPAGRLDDRHRSAAGFVETVEPGIGIGLQNPAIAGEVTFRVIAGAVAGIEKHSRRRIAAAEGPVVAHINPGPSGHRLALGQHRHRRVIAMNAAAGKDMGANKVVERAQHYGTAADLIGQRRQAQIHALPRIALCLPVERLMLPILLEQDHGEQARSGKTARQHVERRRRLTDPLTRPAGELLAHILHDLPLPRHHLQRLGDILTELGQSGRPAAGAGGRPGHDHPLARQMRRQRLAGGLLAGVAANNGRLGSDFILGRRLLQLFQLELHLLK